ncbi:hypothetical protein CRENBAI_017200 [Crenichthys baileyi]|uniref:Uncharacterized protein n=1 Tax=Crenichthys baileyi TaxID=28760 RepID=A0AAV9RJA1_9TELE
MCVGERMCRNKCVCGKWVYLSRFVTWRCTTVVSVATTVEGLQPTEPKDRWTQLRKAAAVPGSQSQGIIPGYPYAQHRSRSSAAPREERHRVRHIAPSPIPSPHQLTAAARTQRDQEPSTAPAVHHQANTPRSHRPPERSPPLWGVASAPTQTTPYQRGLPPTRPRSRQAIPTPPVPAAPAQAMWQ